MMNFNFDYNVDMVFCIDATGSMGGLIEKVKDNALNFYQDVQRMMTNKQKTIAQLRVRVIAFRDYAAERLIDGTLASGGTLVVDADENGEVVLK